MWKWVGIFFIYFLTLSSKTSLQPTKVYIKSQMDVNSQFNVSRFKKNFLKPDDFSPNKRSLFLSTSITPPSKHRILIQQRSTPASRTMGKFQHPRLAEELLVRQAAKQPVMQKNAAGGYVDHLTSGGNELDTTTIIAETRESSLGK